MSFARPFLGGRFPNHRGLLGESTRESAPIADDSSDRSASRQRLLNSRRRGQSLSDQIGTPDSSRAEVQIVGEGIEEGSDGDHEERTDSADEIEGVPG